LKMAPRAASGCVEPQDHPKQGHRVPPFFLVYGAEAILPTDLEYGLRRVRGYDEGASQRAREDSLDQLDEARIVALMHSARYQQALRRYQARKVRRRDFSEGDMVLRLRQDNRGRHKLSPPWEGPYIVVKVLKPGTYKLANEDARGTHQRLEHPAATSLLPLARISKFFVVNYMPNTPVGSLNVKTNKSIKLKGNSAFPRKPTCPRGLLRGVSPPQKWSHFSQKFASALSTIRP
jgi:hypothetical protein